MTKRTAEETAVTVNVKAKPAETPRLQRFYREQIIPKMMQKFGYRNGFQSPRLEKIVVNMGIGEGTQDIKRVDGAVAELAAVTGEHPLVTRAQKAISNF